MHWSCNFINLLSRNLGITKVVGKRYPKDDYFCYHT